MEKESVRLSFTSLCVSCWLLCGEDLGRGIGVDGARRKCSIVVEKEIYNARLLPKLHLSLGGLQAFCHVSGQDQARFADWAISNLSQARLKVFKALGEIVEAEV